MNKIIICIILILIITFMALYIKTNSKDNYDSWTKKDCIQECSHKCFRDGLSGTCEKDCKILCGMKI